MDGLVRAGFTVYLPFGENTRCDLIADDGMRLLRVQCRTGRLQMGSVVFRTCSSYAHHPNPRDLRRDYHGQVGASGVHCRETGVVYLVPIDDLPVRTMAALRVDPPRNNQVERVRFAARYEVARLATAELAGPSGGSGSFA